MAKKGGESVPYQGRKREKTTNILLITESQRFIIASTDLAAGNHDDAYNLKTHLQAAFKFVKRLGLDILGAFFNADKAFVTKEAYKVCFNHAVIPNIDEIQHNRKTIKRGANAFSIPMF